MRGYPQGQTLLNQPRVCRSALRAAFALATRTCAEGYAYEQGLDCLVGLFDQWVYPRHEAWLHTNDRPLEVERDHVCLEQMRRPRAALMVESYNLPP